MTTSDWSSEKEDEMPVQYKIIVSQQITSNDNPNKSWTPIFDVTFWAKVLDTKFLKAIIDVIEQFTTQISHDI